MGDHRGRSSKLSSPLGSYLRGLGARDADAQALENELYGPARVKPFGLVFDLREFSFYRATSLCAVFRSQGLRARSSSDLWSRSLSEVQAAKWAIIGFVERSALDLLNFRLGPDFQCDETCIVLVLRLCAARGVRFLFGLAAVGGAVARCFGGIGC